MIVFLEAGPSLETSECSLYFSESSKSSVHYLNDTRRFDVSSEGPLSGVSVKADEGSLLETSNLFVSFR